MIYDPRHAEPRARRRCGVREDIISGWFLISTILNFPPLTRKPKSPPATAPRICALCTAPRRRGRGCARFGLPPSPAVTLMEA